jgi:hypothetical protein
MRTLNSLSISDWWNGLIGVCGSYVGWHYDYVPNALQGRLCSADRADAA